LPGNSKPRKGRRRGPKRQTVDGILIEVSSGEELNVQTIGKTKLTEAPTLLRLGAKLVEQSLGVK